MSKQKKTTTAEIHESVPMVVVAWEDLGEEARRAIEDADEVYRSHDPEYVREAGKPVLRRAGLQ
jgi:hypothetical protein